MYLFDSKKSIILAAPYWNLVEKEIYYNYREKEGTKGKKSVCCKKDQKERMVCVENRSKWQSDLPEGMTSSYSITVLPIIKYAPLIVSAH